MKNEISQDKTWYRDGYKICYYQNSLKKKSGGYYYTLTFCIKFEHDFDNVYMAHGYPYTYTRQVVFLKELANNEYSRRHFRKKLMCQTVAGNDCDMLVITNHADSTNLRTRKGVFLTSRVHPGENMASYLMENCIKILTGPSLLAKVLRDNFVFYVVPMLNIDGVIIGNYRCNLSAVDLNRQWSEPSKKLHPTIFHTKQMLRKMKEERDVFLYCDFHGHNRKKNIFIYGCPNKDNSRRELIFPMFMQRNCEVFSMKDSLFQIQKDRESCARIALFKEFNIINSFTMEISFLGSNFGKYESFHFNKKLFMHMSEGFLQSILDSTDVSSEKFKEVTEEIDIKYSNKQNVNTTEVNLHSNN